MYFLIYVSSAKPSFSFDQLQEMLTRARARNRQAGITGLLVHRGGNLMQYIEGDEQMVKQLYKTISEDTRHEGLVVLSEGSIEARQFDDWDMNLRNADVAPVFSEQELKSDREGIKAVLADFASSMR